MQNDNREIIDFEDLFKEEKKIKTDFEDDHLQRGKYIKSIIIYLLMMNVFVIFLSLIFVGQDKFIKTTTENELILYEVIKNSNGITLMDPVEFDQFEEQFEDYIISLGVFEGYEVIVNINNTYADDLLVLTSDPLVFNDTLIYEIFNGSSVVTWNDDIEVLVVTGSEQNLPLFVFISDPMIDGPEQDFTDLAYSLINFITYLILTSILLWVLKEILLSDWSKFKKLQHQWYMILVIGYLYIMVGNFVTVQITSIVSSLLGVLPSISLNQLTIENSLNSNGLFFMILSAVILGPVTEELIFRKAIFGLFKKPYVALLVSTLSFGLVHVLREQTITAAIINGISYFTMGLVFGLIYIKYEKNIYAPLLVHILSNAISIITILFIL